MISHEERAAKSQLKFARGTTPLEREQAWVIRGYFADQRARMYSLRSAESVPTVSKLYDYPTVSEECVWIRILRAAGRAYNPLWAVHYHVLQATTSNQDVNAHSMLKAENSPLYREEGVKLAKGAAVTLAATVKLLRDSLPTVAGMYNLSDLSAVEYLRGSFTLDCVLELAWRFDRGLTFKPELASAAQMAYACCPSVYADEGFSEELKQKFSLGEVFDVVQDAVVAAPAVDGVFKLG